MKIGIVGSGMVGATGAYAMIMAGIGREIILVDLDADRLRAEVDDLNHAVPFASPLTVKAGDYPDLAGSRLVVISAGVSQKPGESRLDLLKRNADVFREIVPAILAQAPEAVLVVATNPVDIMTHLAARYAACRGGACPRPWERGRYTDFDPDFDGGPPACLRPLLGARASPPATSGWGAGFQPARCRGRPPGQDRRCHPP